MASARTMPHHPWNAGRMVGVKPPLKPKHIWGIQTRLRLAGRVRDLAMFNLAIDSRRRRGGKHSRTTPFRFSGRWRVRQAWAQLRGWCRGTRSFGLCWTGS